MDYLKLANDIFKEICVIPAPSKHEEKRVEYCVNKLKEFGFDAHVDDAKNVVCEFISDGCNDTVIFEAHTDVVFPDTTPLPLSEDDKNIYNPGCGDDTISVAFLITIIKKLIDENKKPKKNVIIILNSCEEGLGNLIGTREIIKKYGNCTSEFYTFDGQYKDVVSTSVGSHRYKVTVKTKGGHSFNDFGNTNAVHILAQGINKIYEIKIPESTGKTTYNVGIVSGGTSVNTIVQEASMLCEYRSDNYQSLEYMKQEFYKVFDYMKTFADIKVELVGERPCMKGVDESAQKALTDYCVYVQNKHSGLDISVNSGSTDCNIPHSIGIPAICVGTYLGGGAHTREEWIQKDSIEIGFKIVCEIIENYFE